MNRCDGKREFKTQQRTIKQIIDENKWGICVPYMCRKCNYYHMTSRRKDVNWWMNKWKRRKKAEKTIKVYKPPVREFNVELPQMWKL